MDPLVDRRSFHSGNSAPPRYEFQPPNTTIQTHADTPDTQQTHSQQAYTDALPTLDRSFLPHAHTPDDVARAFHSSLTSGLTAEQAQKRLAAWGKNKTETHTVSIWQVVKEELMEPLILLLIVVGILYGLWGRPDESLTAAIVVTLTLVIEFFIQYHAKRTAAHLAASNFHAPHIVVRGGSFLRVPSEELVIGDVVDLTAGERIMADGRIIASTWILIDQAALTGDAHPISKSPMVLSPEVVVSERTNLLHAGTLILHGSARIMVTATGEGTELGRIHRLARRNGLVRNAAHTVRTPLQVRWKELALRLTVVAAVACMVVMSLGFMRGIAYQTVVLIGVALAFASMPDGLPLLVQSIIGVAAVRLDPNHRILVKSLKTAENIGRVTLVLTDKTGTLTRNELSVLRLSMPGRMLRVPPPHSSKPFRASTDDVLGFEPLFSQGWLLSAPTLVEAFASTAQHATPPSLARSDPLASLPIVSDPFDASVVRFFAQPRVSPQDINSTFLRRLFAEALEAARKTQVVHVLPYDAVRRRSSCIRRVWTNAPATATSTPDSSSSSSSSSSSTGSGATSQLRLCTRGGAEFVLAACSYALHSDGGVIKLGVEAREELRSQLRQMSDAGLRIMGFAIRRIEQSDLDRATARGSAVSSPVLTGMDGPSLSSSRSPLPAPQSPLFTSQLPFSSLESHMTFLGFLAFGDSLRAGVEESISTLQGAGIQVKLVTGDFERTGSAVARAVGVLPNTNTKITTPTQRSTITSPNATAGAASQQTIFRTINHRDSPSLRPDPALDGICIGPLRSTPKGARSVASRAAPQLPPFPPLPPSVSATPRTYQQQPSSSPSSRSWQSSPRMTGAGGWLYDLNASVYCRMTPQDKYQLVLAHKRAGHTVLVTGDSPNDGASLTAADCGLAMGSANGGSDLARERAGIILTTDDFRGVVTAVHEGRRTLDNLRRAMRFFIASKFALVGLILLPLACGWDLPLSPVHILILAGLIDLGSSFGFTFESASSGLMRHAPDRWGAGFLKGRKLLPQIVVATMMILASVGSVLFVAHHMHIARVNMNNHPRQPVDTIDVGFVSHLPSSSYSTSHMFLSYLRHSSSSSAHDLESDVRDDVDHELAHLSDESTEFRTPPPPTPTTQPPVNMHPSSQRTQTGHHGSDTATQPTSSRDGAHSPPPPPRQGHSSSSFFPSILSPFARDPHLSLTQSLVFTSWLLTSVLLALFMRSFKRSILFACCDRRAIARCRTKRRQNANTNHAVESSAASAGAATSSERQPLVSSLLSSGVARRQVSYNTLSSIESRDPDVRVDGRAAEVDSEDESDITSGSNRRLNETNHDNEWNELDGLIKRNNGRNHLPNDQPPSSSDVEEVCPLLTNLYLSLWMVGSLGLAFLSVTWDPMRRSLGFAPIFQIDVVLPDLTDATVIIPAYYVLIIPIIMFVCAEIVKFILTNLFPPSQSTTINTQPAPSPTTAAYTLP